MWCPLNIQFLSLIQGKFVESNKTRSERIGTEQNKHEAWKRNNGKERGLIESSRTKRSLD